MTHDPAPSDLLWRLNRTYVQRLGKAYTRLKMLSQLMTERHAGEQVMAAVETARDECTRLYDDHKRWRNTYFYQAPGSTRMIEDPGGINRALAQFARMRQRHALHASEIAVYLNNSRPDSALTLIAKGDDLWTLTIEAFAELQTFEYA